MNWKRGAWRVWVVVSAVWVLTAGGGMIAMTPAPVEYLSTDPAAGNFIPDSKADAFFREPDFRGMLADPDFRQLPPSERRQLCRETAERLGLSADLATLARAIRDEDEAWRLATHDTSDAELLLRVLAAYRAYDGVRTGVHLYRITAADGRVMIVEGEPPAPTQGIAAAIFAYEDKHATRFGGPWEDEQARDSSCVQPTYNAAGPLLASLPSDQRKPAMAEIARRLAGCRGRFSKLPGLVYLDAKGKPVFNVRLADGAWGEFPLDITPEKRDLAIQRYTAKVAVDRGVERAIAGAVARSDAATTAIANAEQRREWMKRLGLRLAPVFALPVAVWWGLRGVVALGLWIVRGFARASA